MLVIILKTVKKPIAIKRLDRAQKVRETRWDEFGHAGAELVPDLRWWKSWIDAG